MQLKPVCVCTDHLVLFIAAHIESPCLKRSLLDTILA